MNYQPIYDNLCARAVALHGNPPRYKLALHQRKAGLVVHHIIPASHFPGGRKNPSANLPANLVWLTDREHLIAHFLLFKIEKQNGSKTGKMAMAFKNMCGKQQRFISSRAYANARRAARAIYQSDDWRAKNRAHGDALKLDAEWQTKNAAKNVLMYQSPEWQKRVATAAERRWAIPESRESAAQLMRDRMADPAYQAKIHAGQQAMTAEQLAEKSDRISKSHKALHENPAYQEAHRERMRIRNDNPEWQANWQAVIDAQRLPVVGFEIGGTRTLYFASMAEAGAEGYHQANVSAVCRGVRDRAYGFTWRHANEAEIAAQAADERLWLHYKPHRNPKLKPAIATELATGLEGYLSGSLMAEEAGFRPANIYSVINKDKSHLGYRFRRATDAEIEAWEARLDAGLIQTFNPVKETRTRVVVGTPIGGGESVILAGASAINAAGFEQSKVSMCLNGKRKKHKGYTWRKATEEEIAILKG